MTKVEDFKIWDIGFNLDIPPFNEPEHKAKIKALLPTKVNQKVKFLLWDTNPAIANAVRRTTISELKIRALVFDISEVKTNDKEIILAELLDRVSLIPIDQDTPLDAVFSLSIINDSSNQEYKVGYSRNMVQVGGKVLKKLPFSETFRLVELRPGRYLEIPRIYVEEGYCYQENGAKFSATAEFKFQCRDYIGVDFLNERGNIIKKMVNREELFALMKKQKISTKEIETELKSAVRVFKAKILVIPNAAYQNMLDVRTRAKVQGYPTIIENPEKLEVKSTTQDDSFLRGYSSEEASPSEYFLEFTTYGTIDPETLLQSTCDNLIDRLTFLQTVENLVVQQDDDKTQIMIRGEDHSLGRMLTRTIYELDPAIGLVNATQEHPQIRVITINIKHPNPMKIFQDAVLKLIKEFQNLKKQFSGAKRPKEVLYLDS